MSSFGFYRVAAACPKLKLADPAFNAGVTLDLMQQASENETDILVFPELSLTGYTCHDLFFQQALLSSVLESLKVVVSASGTLFSGLIFVGVPLVVDDQIFNCAVAIQKGTILGIVPKSYLPNYKEFYDARFFAPAATAQSNSVNLWGQNIPFGTDLLFVNPEKERVGIGVEICEDLWVPIPPSCVQALHGAHILLNLSASNETVAKANYRRQLVLNQSARCIAAYVYAAAGSGESSTDLVFGGHCLIAENGSLLAEGKRFQRESSCLYADVDVEHLIFERTLTTSFGDGVLYSGAGGKQSFRRIPCSFSKSKPHGKLFRSIDPHPFVPSQSHQLQERCEEIFQIQTAALVRRLETVNPPKVAIGVSGGLDSTLALLVLCKAFDQLGWPHERICALTMPGFGTSSRTKNNATLLMEKLRTPYKTIDIRPMAFEEMRALGHSPFGIPLESHTVESLSEEFRNIPPERLNDLVFENIQARLRTNLLMNSGFVIGTGDLSELALGWCTYNADHMSMYNPNVSIPKTLVKFLVRWAAENQFDEPVRSILLDIVATEISPELLPTNHTGQIQSTEATVGPYELHDFFLYHLMRYGTSPQKILYLALQTRFDREYSEEEIRKWLQMFLKRFFNNQFKRSCLPDGPKVGSVSLSPRGDWRMPSDASSAAWLNDLAQFPFEPMNEL